jgi:methyltransferase (TIGR00027 family)
MVAFFRGAASTERSPFRGMRDDHARDLLPAWLRVPLRAMEKQPRLLPAARLLSLGLLDHISLRTAAIDEEARTALARGARQAVILGAGLDARAYRLPELGDVAVFEVDHPATQRHKRASLEASGGATGSVRFVGVDFERDALEERLASAGHDPKTPTLWIWEGVTPYLDKLATESTLGVIGSRSSERSTLLVTYLTPDLVRVPFLPLPIVRAVFSAIGEPIKAAWDPSEMRSLLAGYGFSVASDSGSPEWASRYLVGDPARIVVGERLAAAIALRR